MKRMLVFPITFLLLVMFSSTSFADENRFGIGVRLGYLNYADDSYDAHGVNVEIDDEIIFGANATYVINDYFSLELSLDHSHDADVDLKALGLKGSAGDFSITPLLLTAQYRIPTYATNSNFSPYIGAGFGYYFNDYDSNFNDFANYPLLTIDRDAVDVDDSIGWHVNLGADMFLDEARHMALNFDLKYYWTEADLEYDYDFTIGTSRHYGSGEEDIDLDGFIAAIGIKYYF